MEKFYLQKQIERVLRGKNTSFLNPIDIKYVKSAINKIGVDYNVFEAYTDCEKRVIYVNKPNVTLYEIKTNSTLSHREILGALFSHDLNNDVFGDIIIDDNKYYIIILDKIKPYIINNFDMIGKKKIKLIEVKLDKIKDYKIKYKEISIRTSSLRVDNIISKLIHTSRGISSEYIRSKKIMLNYDVLTNSRRLLKIGDILSIRGIGKYKLVEIKNENNSKLNIRLNKYI